MLCDDALDGWLGHELAPYNNSIDSLDIPNIRQRIGVEQH